MWPKRHTWNILHYRGGKIKTIEVYNNLHKGREISITVFDRGLTEQSICRAQKKKKKAC